MSEMFYNYYSLSIIDLSNFDTSLVKDMSLMFYNVYSEYINVTHFKTSSVENMAGMFYKELSSQEMKNYFFQIQKFFSYSS